MSKLKKEFIIKEIQSQSSYFLEQKSHSELNLPTSFKDYAIYCYKTNNTNALFSNHSNTHISFRGGRQDVKSSLR